MHRLISYTNISKYNLTDGFKTSDHIMLCYYFQYKINIKHISCIQLRIFLWLLLLLFKSNSQSVSISVRFDGIRGNRNIFHSKK